MRPFRFGIEFTKKQHQQQQTIPQMNSTFMENVSLFGRSGSTHTHTYIHKHIELNDRDKE